MTSCEKCTEDKDLYPIIYSKPARETSENKKGYRSNVDQSSIFKRKNGDKVKGKMIICRFKDLDHFFMIEGIPDDEKVKKVFSNICETCLKRFGIIPRWLEVYINDEEYFFNFNATNIKIVLELKNTKIYLAFEENLPASMISTKDNLINILDVNYSCYESKDEQSIILEAKGEPVPINDAKKMYILMGCAALFLIAVMSLWLIFKK